MVDNDIQKVLEQCQIAANAVGVVTLTKEQVSAALALINYYEAENERLKNKLVTHCTPKAFRRVRAETIREIGEAVKTELISIPPYHFSFLNVNQCIDKVLEKMEGGKK